MTKHLLFATLACALLLTTAKAQEQEKPKFNVGLKAGLALSAFNNDVGQFQDVSKYHNNSGYEEYVKIGGMAGITLSYNFTEAFSVGAELLNIGRGASYRQENSSVAAISSQGAEKAYNYYKYKINYLELPLIAEYNLNAKAEDGLAFVIYGGFAPGLVTAHNIDYTSYEGSSSSPIANETTRHEELSFVRCFNLSPVAGLRLGGRGSRETDRIFMDLRVEQTLLPVFTIASDSDRRNYKTGMWTAIVAVGARIN